MGLLNEGINGVRVFELPMGVWANGGIVAGPRICLVKWRSGWQDKIHQVYVNGRYTGTTTDFQQRQILIQTPSCFEKAVRVEVFAVEPEEGEIDFSNEMEKGNGDSGRVKLQLLRSQRLPAGSKYKVYFDAGNGEIDYENPIGEGQVWAFWQDKAGLGLAEFGEGDFGYEWAGGVGFGRGSFGAGEFGVEADIIEWVSPALEAGLYRFAIKVIDENGNESAVSETGEVTVIPAARPASKARVLSFNEETNEMVLGVSSGQ